MLQGSPDYMQLSTKRFWPPENSAMDASWSEGLTDGQENHDISNLYLAQGTPVVAWCLKIFQL